MNFLQEGLSDIQSIRYSHLASASIIIFDHCELENAVFHLLRVLMQFEVITFDSEVELIWKSSWSLGKALFFLNRYYTLISVVVNTYGLFSSTITNHLYVFLFSECRVVTDRLLLLIYSCLSFFQWQGWTGLISCIISEVILQMRIYALYSLDKRVLALMTISFLASIGTSAAIMGSVLSKITAIALPITPNIKFCLPFNISHHFYAFWIPMLAFETLLCGLALFKGYQTFKSPRGHLTSGKHIIGILIRDSLLYFLVMFATYFTNLLIWIGLRQTLLEIPIGFSVALACVMGNRVIFNVRELALEQDLLPHRSRRVELPSSDSISIASRSTLSHRTSLSEHELNRLRSLRVDR